MAAVTLATTVRRTISPHSLRAVLDGLNEYYPCYTCGGAFLRGPLAMQLIVSPGYQVAVLSHAKCAESQVIEMEESPLLGGGILANPYRPERHGVDLLLHGSDEAWMVVSTDITGWVIDGRNDAVGVHPLAMLDRGYDLALDWPSLWSLSAIGAAEVEDGEFVLRVDLPGYPSLRITTSDMEWAERVMDSGSFGVLHLASALDMATLALSRQLRRGTVTANRVHLA